MAGTTSQIRCTACGEDSLLKRAPRYDGFKKVGETLSCAACGHVYASEAEVPFKGRARPSIFDESDKPQTRVVFHNDEKGRMCGHCRHYVVNPFTQRCGKHNRVVEATDGCDNFATKE